MPTDLPASDWLLDRPEVLADLFHPRAGDDLGCRANILELRISLADGTVIGGRSHRADTGAVNILFFHGNGEIAEDYDDLGPLFARRRINFLMADYRGYDSSTGSPTSSARLADSYAILRFVTGWLSDQDHTGPLIVMGRSLGSAPAVELACHDPEAIAGLILESAFAHTGLLLRRLGGRSRRPPVRVTTGLSPTGQNSDLRQAHAHHPCRVRPYHPVYRRSRPVRCQPSARQAAVNASWRRPQHDLRRGLAAVSGGGRSLRRPSPARPGRLSRRMIAIHARPSPP